MGCLFLFVLVDAVFGSTFLDKKPDKPGFYEVHFDETGDYKYVPIKRAQKSGLEKLKANPVTAWDFRKAKSSCQALRTIRDQKSCGGCWAFSSTDAFAAALCLNTGIDKLFSPQYMIDCPDTQKWPDTTGHSYKQQGCQGGYPIIAFQTFNKTGAVNWDCVPYTGKQNSCPSQCTNGAPITKTTLSGSKPKLIDAYKQPLQDLRDLVTTSGPCVAEMRVYGDLSNYKQYTSMIPSSDFDNVYQTTDGGSDFEGHAVTIYGFGTEGSKNYWLVKNSWGDGWPQLTLNNDNKGFFKIRMGLNESGIEDNFYALYDNDNDYTNVPLPTQTTPAKYWNFEDAPDCSLYPFETECKAVEGCKWQTDEEEPEDNWWDIFFTRAKVGAGTKARKSLSSSSSSSSSSASPRKPQAQKRHHVNVSFDGEHGSSALTGVANALPADCHCTASYQSDGTCTNRRGQTSCESKQVDGDGEPVPCFAGATGNCGAMCLWYPKDGTCNKWDYDCTDVYKDIPGRYTNCADGAKYDLTCTAVTNNCKGANCVDHKKSGTCGAASGCKWYAHAKNYFPFCDEADKYTACSDFSKADCLYSIRYGLTCQVVDGTCVDGGVGKCVFSDAAWRAGVPTLMVLVALLFMALI